MLRRFASRRDTFELLCSAYLQRLTHWPQPSREKPATARVGVLVTQWLGTAVPLFSLECALRIQSADCEVTLIRDDTDLFGNASEVRHGHAIDRLIAVLSTRCRVVRPETSAEPGSHDVAEAIVANNAIWRMRGEDKALDFRQAHPEAVETVRAHLGRITRLLSEERFDWILVPGGIFGLSGVYVAAARALQVSFSTFDSAVGVLRLAHDGVAAHLGDLPRSYASLQTEWRGQPEVYERVVALAKAELGDRMEGKDFRQFQVAGVGTQPDLRYDLLVPLNIRWDSAALGRQRLFESVGAWLRALLDWVRVHDQLTICLRQHPRERLDFAKGSDQLQALLQDYVDLGPRLRFIEAHEPVSTYDLLRHAKVVLPHTSTVGIEAAVLGKSVVLSTHCYYESFGFCRVAESREEFFALIEQAIEGGSTVSREQQEDAALAYYLTQRCAFARTEFTGNPVDAEKWLKLSPRELWARAEVADFQQALLSRVPYSLIRHQRLIHAS